MQKLEARKQLKRKISRHMISCFKCALVFEEGFAIVQCNGSGNITTFFSFQIALPPESGFGNPLSLLVKIHLIYLSSICYFAGPHESCPQGMG